MAAKASDVLPVNPPIYLFGAVMDEETRPLLSANIQALSPGEGVLVVFRLHKEANPNVLLETSIDDIAGRGWNYISHASGSSPVVGTSDAALSDGMGWQNLVDGLEADTAQRRVATQLLSQGAQKIKADDNYRICYGIISNPAYSEPITTLRGIVHQQCNMGLNGDLVLHEGEIILQSLEKHHVFETPLPDGGLLQRPIHVQTYGAGGSASSDINPGDLVISDAVIDARTHIDPMCVIEYLRECCSSLPENLAFSDEFRLRADLIIRRFTSDVDTYTSFEMVSDIADLSRLVSGWAGISNHELMVGFDASRKRYYSEITFGTPENGCTLIHRITKDAEGNAFIGDLGQKNALDYIQKFQLAMDPTADTEIQATIDTYHLQLRDTESAIQRLLREKNALETKIINQSSPATKNQFLAIEEQSKIQENEARLDGMVMEAEEVRIRESGRHKLGISMSKHAEILESLREQKNKLIRNVLDDAPTQIRVSYMRTTETLDALHREIHTIEHGLKTAKDWLAKVVYAREALEFQINQSEEQHRALYPERKFSVTACGAYFFMDEHKHAVGDHSYHAKLVEMENALFAQIIHHYIQSSEAGSGLYIAQEELSKIAADPLHISPLILEALNAWAKDYTMTLDDYADAIEWVANNYDFSAFPDSGRWAVFNVCESDPELMHHFMPFGDVDSLKIVNPFWKEIGTDLLQEIINGKAFATLKGSGDALKILEIRTRASELMGTHPSRAVIKDLVRDYLACMGELLQVPGDSTRFKAYARIVPGVLTTGFVTDKVAKWDPYLYKSSNTTVLDQKARSYVKDEHRGKVVGAAALIVSDTGDDGTVGISIVDKWLSQFSSLEPRQQEIRLKKFLTESLSDGKQLTPEAQAKVQEILEALKSQEAMELSALSSEGTGELAAVGGVVEDKSGSMDLREPTRKKIPATSPLFVSGAKPRRSLRASTETTVRHPKHSVGLPKTQRIVRDAQLDERLGEPLLAIEENFSVAPAYLILSDVLAEANNALVHYRTKCSAHNEHLIHNATRDIRTCLNLIDGMVNLPQQDRPFTDHQAALTAIKERLRHTVNENLLCEEQISAVKHFGTLLRVTLGYILNALLKPFHKEGYLNEAMKQKNDHAFFQETAKRIIDESGPSAAHETTTAHFP